MGASCSSPSIVSLSIGASSETYGMVQLSSMSVFYHLDACFVSTPKREDRQMKTFGILAAAAAVIACAPPPPAPPLAPAGIAASVGKTWNTVIDVLSESNIPVKTLDKSSGYIMAEVASVHILDEDKYADCGSFLASLGAEGPMIARYNILVRGDSTTSTVKVTAAFTKTGKTTHECSSKRVFETKFQNDVKARAEGR